MKKFKVIFSPYALDDLDDACNYYRKIDPETELKFLLEIDKKIDAIYINPYFATVKFDKTRCTSLKKFPYSIFYTVDVFTETVIITNIFFAKRRPFW